MSEGQSQRQVDADSFTVSNDGWLIFYRKGREYWRASVAKVVSMETKPASQGPTDNERD
jgi:hypothetical protein